MKSLYLNRRFYLVLAAICVAFILGYYLFFLYTLAKVALVAAVVLLLADLLTLYNPRHKLMLSRETPERLSNGDINTLQIVVNSNYPIALQLKIIDEIPHQFQIRDFEMLSSIAPGETKTYKYLLKPVERGEYNFGNTHIFATALIGFASRRYTAKNKKMVAVYPSFIQMRKYELMAISNRLTEVGIKKIRRVSNNNEFDQIRDYVLGDDSRTVNWLATARRGHLMVNQYQDEKSQQVYSLIDMGRTMKMPFEQMTLLDYAINASLVISNIAMLKHDKAGLITFNSTIKTMLPAQRKSKQMLTILEALYKQTTNFAEANYELLYATLNRKVRHRSLLLLYTNFEGISSMQRQLKFFKRLAKSHLLVVVFFDNTEVKKIVHSTEFATDSIENIYIKTIAEKYRYERKLIVKELNKNGIHSILTEPANLTVASINKYLEIKAQGLI